MVIQPSAAGSALAGRVDHGCQVTPSTEISIVPSPARPVAPGRTWTEPIGTCAPSSIARTATAGVPSATGALQAVSGLRSKALTPDAEFSERLIPTIG